MLILKNDSQPEVASLDTTLDILDTRLREFEGLLS
jgi:hypothetical protein